MTPEQLEIANYHLAEMVKELVAENLHVVVLFTTAYNLVMERCIIGASHEDGVPEHYETEWVLPGEQAG